MFRDGCLKMTKDGDKIIKCCRCKKQKSKNEFYLCNLKQRFYICKICSRQRSLEYSQRKDVKIRAKRIRETLEYKNKMKKYRRKHYLKNRKKILEQHRQKRKDGYYKELYRKKKLGDPIKIKNLCLEHGFSDDIAEAIALNGIILDKKMKEKNIIR